MLPALVVLATVGACGEDRPPIVWEGEHLRFRTNEDLAEVCGGTLAYSDAFVGHLGEVFQEPHRVVDFNWVRDVDSFCPSVAGGCASDGEVFSEEPLHRHELTHAARSQLAYLPLEEGIAELYGDRLRSRAELRPSAVTDVLRAHERGQLMVEQDDYALVGHFASYLRAVHGTDTLMRLGELSDYKGTFAELGGGFERAVGGPLGEVVADYMADYPVCDQTFHVDNSFDCDRNPVVLPAASGEPLRVELPLSCDEPHVLGPRGGQRWVTVALEVPVTAEYRLSFTGDWTSSMVYQVRRCDSSCLDDPQAAPEFGFGLFAETNCLVEGRYLLLVAIDLDEDTTLAFDVDFHSRDASACP